MQTFPPVPEIPPSAPAPSAPRAVVVGGGVGGLCAAIDLARRGLRVTLCEAQVQLGGKVRTVQVAGRPIDSGPTVLTLRSVFDQLFADAGATLDERLGLRRAEVLARHAWADGTRLDLYADVDRSHDEIARVFGAGQADAYLAYVAHCRAIYQEVKRDFVFSQRPGLLTVARRFGLDALTRLQRIDAHRSMWRAVGGFFDEPRLQQLFGRYATYTGASPFQAPATLNLIAHVEQAGVWYVNGGMTSLARALADLARSCGVQLRTGCPVAELRTERGRVRSVLLASGEVLTADAVVVNADVSALAGGLLGPDVRQAVQPVAPSRRSLSALTLSMMARVPTTEGGGFPLVHHNVFFSDDYRAEFDDIFQHGRLPADPTVYLCAQDRRDGSLLSAGPERLFTIVNAPARGDHSPLSPDEIERCTHRTLEHLEACGLRLDAPPEQRQSTRPADFDGLFPGTGGALYGAASHSWRTSFQRSGARSRVPGLYLAGGSVHPGAGLPMVAVSGRLAAEAVLSDLPSISTWRPAATPGGTSTWSPPTATTG